MSTKMVTPVQDSNKTHQPKKATSAFFRFMGERRPVIQQEQHNLKSKDICKLLGNEWRELSEEQKMVYKQQYYMEKAELKNYHEAVAKAREAAISDSFGNLDELEWTRYGRSDVYWEYVIKDNKYLIREGDGTKKKLITCEYMTVEATQKSIASLIRMHELIGYTLI